MNSSPRTAAEETENPHLGWLCLAERIAHSQTLPSEAATQSAEGFREHEVLELVANNASIRYPGRVQ